MSPRDSSPRSGRLPPIRKNLGQHFLNDPRILQRIVDALQLTGDETVVEIGPGRGSLTALLAPVAKRLVLIEYDRMLAARLREQYAASPSVTVIEADVLTVKLGEAAGGPFVLVGNVPYYITTPILFHALEPLRPLLRLLLVELLRRSAGLCHGLLGPLERLRRRLLELLLRCHAHSDHPSGSAMNGATGSPPRQDARGLFSESSHEGVSRKW